jgi:hypothetical protein
VDRSICGVCEGHLLGETEEQLRYILHGPRQVSYAYYFPQFTFPVLTLQRGDLNSDRELLYSSSFLKHMRYKHETFTKMILKDGFISFLLNNIGALYLSNGSG